MKSQCLRCAGLRVARINAHQHARDHCQRQARCPICLQTGSAALEPQKTSHPLPCAHHQRAQGRLGQSHRVRRRILLPQGHALSVSGMQTLALYQPISSVPEGLHRSTRQHRWHQRGWCSLGADMPAQTHLQRSRSPADRGYTRGKSREGIRLYCTVTLQCHAINGARAGSPAGYRTSGLSQKCTLDCKNQNY